MGLVRERGEYEGTEPVDNISNFPPYSESVIAFN